ncbi:C-GCAxxG-C-C family protein [Fundidesulfovibrio terrae]|uniref:C-GCAxxG-C-C family protein n=1 Tax=Fundidesulfovibrio terrae TaxID=2922866 RepID=UPI001FAE8DB0|nr:C-GCAxxG-C-C family protein [Fundidesulfovibrio terrae]
MNKEQVEQRTYELFQGGLICSESVLTAVLEASGVCVDGFAPRMATPFGGGVGRCREEMCGALAGGLIALGMVQGRVKAGESWDDIAANASEFRERVRAITGHTRCKDVLNALGPQENLEKCKRFTARTAGILHEILEMAEPAAAPKACGCCATKN